MSLVARSVLLVGEEPTLAGALAASLDRRGHRTQVVQEVAQARLQRAPDVLVAALEHEPEELAGLLRDWRAQGCEPRALWLTDGPGPRACEALVARGGVVLVKPLRMREFLHAVEAPDELPVGISWRCASRPDPLESVTRDLVAFGAALGLGPTLRARLAGAAGELVENAARHAYVDAAGELDLRLDRRDDELHLSVVDRGSGFHPPPFLPKDGGLARAAALCESFHLDSAPGVGTEVRLRFDLHSTELEGAPLRDLSDRDCLTPREARELIDALERDPHGSRYLLPPSLAVVVGRLLAGATPEVFLGGTQCTSKRS